MKTTVFGFLAFLTIGVVAFLTSTRQNEAVAQRGTPVDYGTELITVAAPTADNGKSQMLTVIDPRTRVMSVYQIELGTGTIALKSVRNIQWDLHLVDFNGVAPLPREVRAQLESQPR